MLVEAGVIRMTAGRPMSFRLAQLFEDLDSLLAEVRPDRMVVEKLFSHYRHVVTSIQMGHARGVVLLAGERHGIEIDEGHRATVQMTLTSPHCPVAETLPEEVRQKVLGVPGIEDAAIDLVWDPPWNPSMMSEDAKLALGF